LSYRPPSPADIGEMAKALGASGFELVFSRADRAVIEADSGECDYVV